MTTSKRSLGTCSNGHEYYKSSDCPVCPTCEKERKPDNVFLSKLSAPARRALEHHSITASQRYNNYQHLAEKRFYNFTAEGQHHCRNLELR